MKCRQSEKIRPYRSGQLNASDRKLFEKHLSRCPDCSAELKMLNKVKKTLTYKEYLLPEIDVVNKVLKKISGPKAISQKRAGGAITVAAPTQYKPRKK